MRFVCFTIPPFTVALVGGGEVNTTVQQKYRKHYFIAMTYSLLFHVQLNRFVFNVLRATAQVERQ